MEWMDATFWAFVALVLFLALVVYFGLPKAVAKLLDAKIAQIQAELDSAKRLRAEAEQLLVEYEQKRVSAEAEAAEIVVAAQREAERMTVEANASLEDLIARRTRAVEDKIAQAEAQALAEVRARAADVAIEAARLVLTNQMAEKGDALIDRAISDVGSKLN